MTRRWLYLGVSAATCGTLVLELALTRVFSVIMYHHFTFLAVSVALFGLGAAGVMVYLRPRLTDPERTLPLARRYAVLAAVAVVVAAVVILQQKVGVGIAAKNIATVTLIYLVAAVPFFLAGITVTLVVTRLREEMSRLYFADLVGAAVGCLLVVPLLEVLGGPSTVLVAGALFGLGALAFGLAEADAATVRRAWLPGGLSAALLLMAAVANAILPWLRMPSAKETVEERVQLEEWNSFSRVTVETTPHDFMWLRIDSSAATKIFSGELERDHWEATRRFSENRVASAVYAVERGGHALIIGPGGGGDVISALYFGRHQVIGVEVNPLIANDVMRGRLLDYTGHLYERPEVQLEVGDGRAWVRASSERFTSIQATLVDTWAASAAGAFTLSENNLYTREAFGDYLTHLTDDGILTMTRWREPPREFLRLLVLGRAALDDLGVSEHAQHFYVIADQRLATFLLKRTPFTEGELTALDAYAAKAQLTTLYAPGRPAANAYNQLLSAVDWRQFVADFKADISPSTDDRPFFFYTMRSGDLLRSLLSPGRLSHENLGLALLVIALLVVTGLVVIFLVLPLFLLRRDVMRTDRAEKARFLAYFIAIGVGFITLEMSLLQTFVVVLGRPVLSLVAVLFSLLVAGGLGSYCSGHTWLARLWPRLRATRVRLAARVLLLAVVPLCSPYWSDLIAPLPLVVRVLAVVAFVTPVGFLLGAFLPLGIMKAGERLGALVPWAWGLNGAASVLGSVLAVTLAMNAGFVITMVAGLACYVLALLAMSPQDTTSRPAAS
jgi:hypothetical protein